MPRALLSGTGPRLADLPLAAGLSVLAVSTLRGVSGEGSLLSGFVFQAGADLALQCRPSPCSRLSAIQPDAVGLGGSSTRVWFFEPLGPCTPCSPSFSCQAGLGGPLSTNCLVFCDRSVSTELSQIWTDLFWLSVATMGEEEMCCWGQGEGQRFLRCHVCPYPPRWEPHR